MGVIINQNEYQIILGPGFVTRVANDFGKMIDAQKTEAINVNLSVEDKDLINKIDENNFKTENHDIKQRYRAKTKASILNFFNKISLIFTPFIPAFLATGVLQAIGSIILTSVGQDNLTQVSNSWINITTLLLTLLVQILCILIGWNTAKVFGGTPIIGALLAAMYTPAFGAIIGNIFQIDGNSGTFLGIPITDISKNWFTVGVFRDGKAAGLTGSIFGAITVAGVAAVLEKQFNKFIPDGAKLFVVPFSVCVIMILVNFVLLVPLTGYVFLGMSKFFQVVTTNKWATPPLGAILAGVWLWLVVFGVHQGATPIYLMLIADTGLNTLFPLVAVAGAGQVGAALALYFKAKKGSKIRQEIGAAIVPGFLGIGEPLIYGVMLTRLRAFITACCGAAIGGLYMGLMPLFGINVGTIALGPSGLLAIPLMSASNGLPWTGMLIYLSGLVVTYISGFLLTYFFGTKGVDLK
ncbi:PTS system N-acetylmuramic acid-specific EIIBC component [Spiroplasma clarkii]|nr:PTS transporter subunit EIIC [Spiroplasma clarkii]ARU91856.1 PTS system N-acetylmuramic acid-specific EIIBC component [Spiroplasma clarkii]